MPSPLNKISNSIATNPLFIIIILLLVLIVVLAIFRNASPYLTLGFGVNAHIGELRGSFELEAFNNQTDSQPMFIMYYADWCGHCKRAKPEFQKLIDSHNKDNLKIIMINAESDENKDLVQREQIKGFPTVKFYPAGLSSQSQEYNGERTYDDFVNYLSSM